MKYKLSTSVSKLHKQSTYRPPIADFYKVIGRKHLQRKSSASEFICI